MTAPALDPEYAAKIGEALWAFANFQHVACYKLLGANNDFEFFRLMDMSWGKFNTKLLALDTLPDDVREFLAPAGEPNHQQALGQRRHALAHAIPTTSPEGYQRFYRQNNERESVDPFRITPDWLEAFANDCLMAQRSLQALV